MPDATIPTNVSDLVAACLPSVAHLEALLFMRARCRQTIAADAVASSLFIADNVALCSRGSLRERSIASRSRD